MRILSSPSTYSFTAFVLAAGLWACGDGASPDAGADAGMSLPDAMEMDATQADAEATDAGFGGSLALTRAFSADGLTVTATFSAGLDPSTVSAAAFRVDSPTAQGVVAVQSATALGAQVTLTLASALPRGPVYTLVATGLKASSGDGLDPTKSSAPLKGTLHLALIWHQHQPVYIDPADDYLRGPWVRKHGTKDYFDMAATLRDHPEIHVAVNLTPVLLSQLQTYYLDRIGPFVDVAAGTIDIAGYFAQRPSGPDQPISDPWIDALLTPTPAPAALTTKQRGWFYADIWSNFSISDVMIDRFPAYKALRTKKDTAPATLTQADLLQIKGWFQLAWFDPDFLRGPVAMPNGGVVDLSDLVSEDATGHFELRAPFTEEICQRLVVEEYKVLSNIVAIHKALFYDAEQKTGQIEVLTTPYYHPILPLLTDTDLAKTALPGDPMPQHRFQYPSDAQAQVAKAVALYTRLFEHPPTGMWPAEGSVAQEVVQTFVAAGVKWVATDRKVLERSTPPDQPLWSPYKVTGASADDQLAIVFRDTEISDKVGFAYQGQTPAQNVTDLAANLRRYAPAYGEERMLSVILDGENAWEWYRLDNDGKNFQHAMYRMLTEAQHRGEFRTAAVSEYLSGNAARSIAPHPTDQLPAIEHLWPGSWIGGSYSTWIGEEEENLAWDYLWKVRQDVAAFERAGMTRPDPAAPTPMSGTPEWYRYQAWESLYAAEGSDWFWWYGSDQTAVGGDEPFDRLFVELLRGVYRNAQRSGITTEIPDFAPILRYCQPPTANLSAAPMLDGQFTPDDLGTPTNASEWTTRGAGACVDRDSAATLDPRDEIAISYWGLSADAVWVALRMNTDLAAKLGTDYSLRLYFSQKHIVDAATNMVTQEPKLAATRTGSAVSFTAGGAAREIAVDFSGMAPVATTASVAGGVWSAPAPAPMIGIGFTSSASTPLIELRVPFSAINFTTGDPLELEIVAAAGGQERDRFPNFNGLVLAPDRTLMVEVTFVLDATGVRLPLSAVKPIDNLPPPRGNGAAFIVGNQAALGNWTPNTIPMSDDGAMNGDMTAQDNYWTFRMLVPPLTDVQYKYTIGHSGDGWGPTEEYPLTNRGLTITDRNGDRKMEIHDVFADRPEPSGSMSMMSQVAND